MYVTPAIIAAAQACYGTPRVIHARYDISPAEATMVRSSQRDGRAHDVTVCVFNRERLAVIAKPGYPVGAYRVPGGALRLGEALDVGGAREAFEETGLRAHVQRFLLHVHAHFTTGDDAIEWTTYVLGAGTEDEALDVHDVREIREARWSSLTELTGPTAAVLRGSGRPLFAYRADLHDWIATSLTPGDS